MQLVATKTFSTNEQNFSVTPDQKNQETEYQGKPVYLFRSQIAEMSQLGLDLTVEPFDVFDF